MQRRPHVLRPRGKARGRVDAHCSRVNALNPLVSSSAPPPGVLVCATLTENSNTETLHDNSLTTYMMFNTGWKTMYRGPAIIGLDAADADDDRKGEFGGDSGTA